MRADAVSEAANLYGLVSVISLRCVAHPFIRARKCLIEASDRRRISRQMIATYTINPEKLTPSILQLSVYLL